MESLQRLEVHKLDYKQLLQLLPQAGLEKLNSSLTEACQYAVKGDVISAWIPGYPEPIRFEYFGDKLEHAYMYDRDLGQKLHTLSHIFISSDKIDTTEAADLHVNVDTEHAKVAIFNNFIPEQVPGDIETIGFDYTYPQLFWNRLDLFKQEVHRLHDLGYKVGVQSRHWGDLDLEHNFSADLTDLTLGINLPAGFISSEQKQAVFTDREIFGSIFLSQRKVSSSNTAKLLQQFEGEIAVGAYVVHEDYGVAMYAGLTQETIDGQLQEYLQLKYAAEDELLVPVNQITKLTRYIGNEDIPPKLSRLGYADWETAKQKVKKSVSILARELIEHYAKREVIKAPTVEAKDSDMYQKFLAEFKYTETKDQLRCTAEIVADMQHAKPMNRLLVGDVGFGKTEVMMRAAFKAIEAGMQVAVLCPTTVLSAQHFAVFSNRFKNFPIKIANISRYNTPKENAELVDQINAGKIDIAIGTHALLRNDLKFKKLGLFIVDEEQRFGVAQKEKIKRINTHTHFLSVTATPIPRTLSMALSSIQEISIISTPPADRKPIETELLKNDWDKIAKAIEREVTRGGQVYFVHNAVQTIAATKAKLESLLPGIRIVVGHGQMLPAKLDQVMTDFYDHKFDILLCTTIIENGLDMPNVNTIVIDQAYRFGLSQLYQLRGRVGRSERKAYCYLFYEDGKIKADPELEKKQMLPKHIERMQAIVDASELGAGFQVASRDLEIRGAGNVLGEQQHGFINTIGYALYMQLLSQEVEKLKNMVNPNT